MFILNVIYMWNLTPQIISQLVSLKSTESITILIFNKHISISGEGLLIQCLWTVAEHWMLCRKAQDIVLKFQPKKRWEIFFHEMMTQVKNLFSEHSVFLFLGLIKLQILNSFHWKGTPSSDLLSSTFREVFSKSCLKPIQMLNNLVFDTSRGKFL